MSHNRTINSNNRYVSTLSRNAATESNYIHILMLGRDEQAIVTGRCTGMTKASTATVSSQDLCTLPPGSTCQSASDVHCSAFIHLRVPWYTPCSKKHERCR